ncbi:hypothetical protein BDY17DRAFT_308228 [Neohortaea acidophila]|uniref:F-box domain-containing protein n=1 Tax=Neohortaea acidophila TaxID=245834 RepID=A0A6A6Q493_9PEZI|nr:uncharacterized protein BDY17DRAFT_308228 [Neohortaea acidophila]KAF2486871.1 hypothetical protein BDY17DRAFT_308228 [Neohortaea acidophila]
MASPAAALPLEVLLQLFNSLDARSYFAARKVCRWWYTASFDLLNTTRLLETLPLVSPRVSGVGANNDAEGIYALCKDASRTLMLETSIRRSEHNEDEGESRALKPCSLPHGLPAAHSIRTGTMVVLDGSTIRVFDTSTSTEILDCQRRVHARFGSGLWMPAPPPASCKIALAANGRLLALAHMHTIQLYDLTAGSERCLVSDDVSSVNENSIVGVEFAQRAFLLRVHLSQKGQVVYLGSPAEHPETHPSADFEHWEGTGGLNNRFLDSSLLVPAIGAADGQMAWLSGLQLLRPLQKGYFFAAQRHGGGHSSRYTLSHIKVVSSPLATVDGGSVVEVNRLESFLSAQDYNLAGLSDINMGTWGSMPSAHEHRPRFMLSACGRMLVLAEREKRRDWPTPSTQLFVYRLAGMERIAKSTADARIAKLIEAGSESNRTMHKTRVAAVPVCLGATKGQDLEVLSEPCDGATALGKITLTTNETRCSWVLNNI